MEKSFSFSQNAWKRLKKNKGAIVGLAVICCCILIGIFAYFISPDSTPNADRQMVEIQARQPGFQQLFLKIKKEKKVAAPGFLGQLLWGKEDNSLYLPINTYRGTPDSVIVSKYIDEGVEERQSYARSALPATNFIVTKTFWLG